MAVICIYLLILLPEIYYCFLFKSIFLCRGLLDAWDQNIAGRSSDSGNSRDWPVLIIDEANALMQWSDISPLELSNLLSFFVKITKQDGRCHVLMATSDFGYQIWLDNGRPIHIPSVSFNT